MLTDNFTTVCDDRRPYTFYAIKKWEKADVKLDHRNDNIIAMAMYIIFSLTSMN
jgi:hypothetical protein